MNIRRWIRNFFGFTRNQTNGFIFLLPLVAIFIFSEPIKRWYNSTQPRDFSSERATLDSLASLWQKEEINTIPEEETKSITLFAFDPNTVTEEGLNALGFSKGLTSRLINYRKKGGNFKTKGDLLKLYGMDSLFYATIEHFVVIPESKEIPEKTVPIKTESTRKEPIKFDLNLADTSVLKTIYGIGTKLSSRIYAYREALGGFTSPSQVYEVYGLDSVVVDRLIRTSFIREDFFPRQLNLNLINEQDLSAHPYISKRMARAIVTYRYQHGKFGSVEDLRKILQLDDNQINKIKPYLTVDN